MQKPRIRDGACKSTRSRKGGIYYGSLDADTASGITQKKTDEAQAQNRALAESEGGWHRNCWPSSASIYHYFHPIARLTKVPSGVPVGPLAMDGFASSSHA